MRAVRQHAGDLSGVLHERRLGAPRLARRLHAVESSVVEKTGSTEWEISASILGTSVVAALASIAPASFSSSLSGLSAFTIEVGHYRSFPRTRRSPPGRLRLDAAASPLTGLDL